MSAHAIESRILSMAARIAADEAEVRRWYHGDAIAGLDGRTARELVRAGRGLAVLDFLQGVLLREEAGACG